MSANGNGGENDDCAPDNYASSIIIHYLCQSIGADGRPVLLMKSALQNWLSLM